jgi:hypothetical protein
LETAHPGTGLPLLYSAEAARECLHVQAWHSPSREGAGPVFLKAEMK